ncbi:UDP-glucose 4-epimerase GalE [Singulisphaera sp. Ch08]|uniref:UDP-glucose 4-epimerase n=1 Tax=Singulisphaera sp. Ch08 TaxID=3120278 RepID=A0AAU7CM43_9BACT
MSILVVGGAGYIGSHTVRELEKAGHDVWVFDNLSQGHAQAVRGDRLIQGDLLDRAALDEALRGRGIDAVMHFAAFASVPESVAQPAKYYRNNVVGTLNLLDAMHAAGVSRIVFSSTSAVYGVPDVIPITEGSPTQPINPYGFTKLAIERALADYSQAYGLGYAVLRYFNACGASSDATIGEDHTPETHLIPIILQVALGQRESLSIFGDDYPTPDGTCIRDYIHVEDLADAHVRALAKIEPGRGLTYNVGTGVGASVRGVLDAALRITGRPIPAVVFPRRPGDPPALVASSDAIQRDLGWSPKYAKIEDAVASAWKWHTTHLRGYSSRS